LMRHLKSPQFVCLLLKLGWFSWFNVCAVSVIKTDEWSEYKSKHCFTVKSWGIPFVRHMSTRCSSLFQSDDQYVSSPPMGVLRCCFPSFWVVHALSIWVWISSWYALHCSLLLQWTDVLWYCKNLWVLASLCIWVEDTRRNC
jgi:hypothetical protein